MKSLSTYINESEKLNKKKLKQRAKIQFTIWDSFDKQVNWLKDNTAYQKIEYKYDNDKKGVTIVFLLGFNEDKEDWQLWFGKLGIVNYYDEPYCSLGTSKFNEAILNSLDKIQDIIEDIEKNPKEWPQFYID